MRFHLQCVRITTSQHLRSRLTGVVAAPLSFAYVHIRVDVNALIESHIGNMIPDLKSCGIFGPLWILRDDVLGDFGSEHRCC